jgi:hypothetical protein
MNERPRQDAGAAKRGDGGDGARMTKARRNAWLLAGFAVFVYLGYVLWFIIRGSNGG